MRNEEMCALFSDSSSLELNSAAFQSSSCYSFGRGPDNSQTFSNILDGLKKSPIFVGVFAHQRRLATKSFCCSLCLTLD
jgi:hypothetical protein